MGRSVRSTMAGVVALLGVALAQPGTGVAQKRLPSKSIGAPNAGHLENGVHLAQTSYLKYMPGYSGDAHWGLKELVDLVDRSAREVHRRFPDAILGVGQLSRKGGGEIDRHASHESGRDADLAFYLVDEKGKPVPHDRFYAIRPDGVAASNPHVRFDDARNWALIVALLSDPHARVTHVFVESHLRTRLLAYGAKIGASTAFRVRVAETLMQPHHALPHDDHFHVRIACPSSSHGCVEQAIVAKTKTTTAKPTTKKTKPAPPKHTRPRSSNGKVTLEPRKPK